MKLNDNERKVLSVLGKAYDGGGGFYSFASLEEETKLDRKTVRRACRSLKRKGLARFAIGLWTEDGEPRGSGYGATKDGAELMEHKP